MNTKRLYPFFLLLIVVAAAHAQMKTEKVLLDETPVTCDDMSASLTIDADYPVGNDVATMTLQRWFSDLVSRNAFRGDLSVAKPLVEWLREDFKKTNNSEDMKEIRKDGMPDGPWYRNIRLKKEFENKSVVSYTYSWDAFYVGNAVSNASILDITVCKSDGRLLGWEMFTSVRQLKKLIDKQLITKYGEGADLYLKGQPPMPLAPLFLKDGVRFDFGDYTIVEAHVYENMGSYPFAFLAYEDIQHLLTTEAQALLGFSKQSPATNEPEPVSTSDVSVQLFRNLLKGWDNVHNLRQMEDFNYEYAKMVDYYGQHKTAKQVEQSKTTFLQKTPDYEQVSYRLKVTRVDASHVRCDFLKRVTAKGKTRVYPSYLYYVTDDNEFTWQIERESDQVTDKNLEKMNRN